MSADRIIDRFDELSDVRVARAAVSFKRLNADGTVTERTAKEVRDTDLGAPILIRNATDIINGGKHVFLGAGISFTNVVTNASTIVADTYVYNASGQNLDLEDAFFSDNLYIRPGHYAVFTMTPTGGGAYDFVVSATGPALAGTIAQFNAALTDGDFATQDDLKTIRSIALLGL